MKIRYLLKKRGKKASTHPIYIALYQADETELIYTKERIALKDWSVGDGLPKDHRSDTFTRIDAAKTRVHKAMRMLEAQDRPITPFTLKQEYIQSQRKKVSEQALEDKKNKQGLETVSSLAMKWLESQLFRYKPSTQKTIRQSLGQFLLFIKTAGLHRLERQQLSPEVISAYERYLQEKKRLSNSTHGRTMKHLRWFLKTLHYDVRSIVIRHHKKEIVALTFDELRALENVDVSSSKEKQKAKDLFLLGCYTGLRISDLKRLNETRIIDGKITMTLQKNQKEVAIPLLPAARKILQAYGMMSPKISEQELNKSIKEVCKLAGINRVLTVKTNVAGLDVEKRRPKSDLITSHTSSKTFITLAPERFGLTPAEIAAIVGKDLKTLINHYFQLPRESAINKMMNHQEEDQPRLSRRSELI